MYLRNFCPQKTTKTTNKKQQQQQQKTQKVEPAIKFKKRKLVIFIILANLDCTLKSFGVTLFYDNRWSSWLSFVNFKFPTTESPFFYFAKTITLQIQQQFPQDTFRINDTFSSFYFIWYVCGFWVFFLILVFHFNHLAFCLIGCIVMYCENSLATWN